MAKGEIYYCSCKHKGCKFLDETPVSLMEAMFKLGAHEIEKHDGMCVGTFGVKIIKKEDSKDGG